MCVLHIKPFFIPVDIGEDGVIKVGPLTCVRRAVWGICMLYADDAGIIGSKSAEAFRR